MGKDDLHTVERRSEPRQSIGNQVVLVDLGDGRGAVSCCIWDISARGACLMVPPDIPTPLNLRVYLDTGWQSGAVVWRRWSHVGIKFAEE
jgi:hypothetical protein